MRPCWSGVKRRRTFPLAIWQPCSVGRKRTRFTNIVPGRLQRRDGDFVGDVPALFVNATNITYMTAGELAFKPMFQAIVLSLLRNQPLREGTQNTHGRWSCQLADRPARTML